MSLDDRALERLRSQIEELADAEVAGLVEEARVEARARARGVLVEAIADQLLERAHHELAPAQERSPARARPHERERAPSSARVVDERARAAASEPPGAPEAAPPQPAGEPGGSRGSGLYVYGIVAEDYEPDAVDGIDGTHALTVIAGEGLAAVVSVVALDQFGEHALEERVSDLEWLEQTARRHELILEQVREHTTLVPMRLCTIYESERSVREMLSREHEFLADALRRLAGRTEWGVKIFSFAGADSGDAGAGDGEEVQSAGAGQGGPGERYLRAQHARGRRREEVGERVREACEQVHERVRRLAVEAKVNSLQPPELTGRSEQMVFNGVYLVDDGDGAKLDGVIAELQEEHAPIGLEVELTGPWPPYNFVNSPTEVGR